MFGFSDEISSRTRGALEAAIRANTNSYIQAYWIDAVCVPRSGPERIATLESMGLIYSRATCCIVLLERSTFFAVWRSARGRARDTDIATIDREPWIRSVWTYQEVVNASTITITTFDLETPMRMDGNDLFSTTGKALRDVEENADVRGWDLAQRYPGISALEGTLADWQVGEYLGMSALTCLTGIAGRHCDPERPSNRLFALFGVLTNEASWQTSDEEGVTSLTEEAIRLCERNGDFSFIYTSNVRESSANRRWRPLPDPEHGLLPILRWHSWGVGQPGTLTDFGLELHDMAPLESSSEPSSEAVKAVQYWLQSFSGTKPHSIEEIHAQLPTDLSKLGLKPGAKCTTSNHGFIMTSFDLTPAEEVHYFAAASLCWTFGAPGIAKIVKQGVLKRCIPIVHVGRQFQDVTDRVSVQLW
ncbi:hypothetical protein CLAFUW4_12654 [Fulvia fulva]|uniref:Heterokaryon incompatibility domain-containing protein n=1 Tax=Passalora fulva TaxID=5499 RepID=A0A9Q8UVH1_PASFU|nr:uncharacterized protein CLAFUR5_12522 [Fulvia fulva]KAK4611966.1 hypothetical protein CLAFUR4_12659 [Fulvia fulva]KAK4612478.1 hypothetical protein CLAFUR0_12670 [Fulvia fulva]UJO23981.1 hypothetical protein CLAFUR5_12522 [Fulvia fulva]WPV20959.1 hypothetical protein CLAFUW4_12654 [Fulvia fulva]WPV36296.1 hypothetical protein CLAFUW7_12661 [Fulvia fulva]